jgi:hypothetical protein
MVHNVVRSNPRDLFRRRLTVQASEELACLTGMIQEVALSSEPDEHQLDINHRLLSGLIYKAATRGDHGCPSYTFVWKNFAPPRVKFFGWLLTRASENTVQSSPSLQAHSGGRDL